MAKSKKKTFTKTIIPKSSKHVKHMFGNSIFPSGKPPSLNKNQIEKYPKNYDTTMKIELGKKNKNRYLLYYFGKDSEGDNSKDLYNHQVYDNIDYYVIKLDSMGKGMLKFKCPPIYIVNKHKNIQERHIHYILSNKDGSNWKNKVYQKEVECDIDIKMVDKLVKQGKHLFINALPYKYFVQDRVPGSICLPHDDLFTNLGKKEVYKFIIDNHPLQDNLRDNRTLPIVCYCYNDTCEADCDLKEKLNSIGFKNILVYSGGITDYRKHHKK